MLLLVADRSKECMRGLLSCVYFNASNVQGVSKIRTHHKLKRSLEVSMFHGS
jgi:hypothetical protein